jgi:mRNA interferase RelE/StbE
MKNLPNELKQRVIARIFGLSDNPYRRGSTKLRGRAGFRVRVGDYRVMYDVDDGSRTLSILRVRHRREGYR